MSTTSFQLQSREQRGSGKLTKPLTYDFALLGLSTREARVDTIRDAATRRAERIHATPQMSGDIRQDLLSELAISTYRVLDPRRRSKLMERIQLCLISDADYDRQRDAHEPLVEAEPFVVAELVEVEANHNEAQLREAKREFVRSLLDDRRKGPCDRVGAVVISVLVATMAMSGLISAAILL